MSWDPYATYLQSFADEAAIFGKNGVKWTATAGLANVTAQEAVAIVQQFTAPDYASGIRVNGTKYFLTRADDEKVLGKKGKSAIVISQSNQALIFGLITGDSDKSLENATSKIVAMAVDLKGKNF